MVSRLRLVISSRALKAATGEGPVDITDPLITQDGLFIGLNQSPLLVLLLEQDFETTGNSLETQDIKDLITQDGRDLITQRLTS